jgi:hypothetical protein
VAPPDASTDESLDWTEKLDLTRPRLLRPSFGWMMFRDGVARGSLIGACLETIWTHLRGSDAWLDLLVIPLLYYLRSTKQAAEGT